MAELPSLRQLEAFAAVAESLSFRKAAEACFISQPALSAQIQQLEQQLGVRLFERDRRRVALTTAGEELLPRAREALASATALVDAAHQLQAPLTGVLRLGVIPTVAPYVLPAVLPVVRKRWPKLRLLLREERTAELLERLAAGSLDLLLLALEAPLGDVATLPLYKDPFLLAVPRGHALAKRKTVREADLGDEPVLLLEDGHCLRDQALSLCDLTGAKEVGDFRASSLNTLVRMVAGGLGVTLLPGMAAPSEVSTRDRLVVRPLGKDTPGRTIGFAWRKTSGRVEEFRMLAECFRESPPKGVEVLGGR
jgi:LysR family hydrogen peroxide-inducible transcriptional activator